LDACFDLALLAPTSHNLETWQFIDMRGVYPEPRNQVGCVSLVACALESGANRPPRHSSMQLDRRRDAQMSEDLHSRETIMKDSRELAGLIGPTMVALGVTEAMNINVFANQIAPVVYLNGAILFVIGLAVVRAHNLWIWRWPVIVTLTGWVTLIGGLWRMAVPGAPQAAEHFLTYVVLAAIGAIGAILSFKAYRPNGLHIQAPSDV
jgi:hypothetical protein